MSKTKLPFNRPKKHSLTLKGHRTSITLEDMFWKEFCRIAKERNVPINTLATEIDNQRGLDIGLASAIRLYILSYHLEKNKELIE